MTKDLNEIRSFLQTILKKHKSVLKATTDTDEKYEVSGTIEAMQGKKKVDGIYFATVNPKPKDVRFYFFPLYTHREQIVDSLSEELKKALKGKTCFHIKSISDDMKKEVDDLVSTGIKLCQKDGLLDK